MKEAEDYNGKIRRLLLNLRRVEAPPDFEEKLRRRIASGGARRRGWRGWNPVFAVPAATLVVVGIISSALYLTQFDGGGIPTDRHSPEGGPQLPESEQSRGTLSESPDPAPTGDEVAGKPAERNRERPVRRVDAEHGIDPDMATESRTPSKSGRAAQTGQATEVAKEKIPPRETESIPEPGKNGNARSTFLKKMIPTRKGLLPSALTDSAAVMSSPLRTPEPLFPDSSGEEDSLKGAGDADSSGTPSSPSAADSLRLPDRRIP